MQELDCSRHALSNAVQHTYNSSPNSGLLCRYAISQHPEVEAKIVEELQALGVMPSAERPQARELTYADTCELTYLQAVIKVRALLDPARTMVYPTATGRVTSATPS